MRPGRPARHDYEYERNGTANLFMLFAPLEGWRRVKVTDRHTAVDYAHVLKDLADIHFSAARIIVLVQDNLNIHSKASLYEAAKAGSEAGTTAIWIEAYFPRAGEFREIPYGEGFTDRIAKPSSNWNMILTRPTPTASCASWTLRRRLLP